MSASAPASIYLIPGFFGFANLGQITYFHHIREFLEERLEDVEVHYVSTNPTSSLRRRAAHLLDAIASTAPIEGPIHLIGHSTGGLDARLFTSPGVSLDDLAEIDVEPWAERVRTVVTVATPHRGTPIAFFFDSILGQKLLYLLSLVTVYALRFGQFPLSALFTILGLVTRLDDRVGWRNTVLDQFYERLFSDFDDEDLAEINAFLHDVRTDQSLLGQLTAGGMDLFNATTQMREGVAYGSVITRARRPEMRSVRDVGFDPYAQASHLVYSFIHLLTSFAPEYPELTDEQRRLFIEAYGEIPSREDSDGVVPTWSQIFGEIIHVTRADHLDVCGHFRQPEHDPPHVDWLASGTGFERARFDALWEDVAGYLLEHSGPAR